MQVQVQQESLSSYDQVTQVLVRIMCTVFTYVMPVDPKEPDLDIHLGYLIYQDSLHKVTIFNIFCI